MTGVFEICGAAAEGDFASLAKALFCCLLMTRLHAPIIPSIPTTRGLPLRARRFGADLSLEFRLIDDESLVPPAGDQVHPIVGAQREGESSAVDGDQFDGRCDLEPRR